MDNRLEIGGNNPPYDVLLDRLQNDHQDITTRRAELESAFERMPDCVDDESAGKIGDFIKQLSACFKDAEARRVMEKEPFLENGRRVDGFFKSITEKMDEIKRKANAPLTSYLRAKEEEARRVLQEKAAAERKAQLEAEQAAQAAWDAAQTDDDINAAAAQETIAIAAADTTAKAEKSASQVAANLSGTRSHEAGSLSSLRTTWEFRDLNRAAIDLEMLRPHLQEKAIESAVRSFIKAGGRELNGVVIFEDKQGVVR